MNLEDIRHLVGHLLGSCGDSHPSLLSVFMGDIQVLSNVQQLLKLKLKL
jgi:hypothetical protein